MYPIKSHYSESTFARTRILFSLNIYARNIKRIEKIKSLLLLLLLRFLGHAAAMIFSYLSLSCFFQKWLAHTYTRPMHILCMTSWHKTSCKCNKERNVCGFFFFFSIFLFNPVTFLSCKLWFPSCAHDVCKGKQNIYNEIANIEQSDGTKALLAISWTMLSHKCSVIDLLLD